jgi:hypothetical protein
VEPKCYASESYAKWGVRVCAGSLGIVSAVIGTVE